MTTIIPQIHSACYAEHNARVTEAESKPDDFFACAWLESLASRTGNDILQKVAVESVGKINATCKHGADSTDGELEAKPFKRKYDAHISDDTPASLLRHHKIPFIILLSGSDDGRIIYWAVLLPYRLFDTARARGMGFLTGDEELPTDISERFKRIKQFEAARTKGKYMRSNPLPYSVLESLKPGEFDIWVNPDVECSRPDYVLVCKLAESNIGMSDAVAEQARSIACEMSSLMTADEAAKTAEKAAKKAAEKTAKKAAKAAK